MAGQTATTGNLASAQNIVIATCRYVAESEAPCKKLIENFTLGKGEKSMIIPKVGQVEFNNLTDGQDIISEQAIGLNYTSLTTGEVGGKFIITDKLLRQFNEDVFKVIGKQMGDAMARKVDRDIIALFSALNGSTTLGADNVTLTFSLATSCIIRARANLYPNPISIVHHPNALGNVSKGAAAIGQTYYAGIMPGLSEELLRNFWKMNIDGVNLFWDANIDKISTADSGYGAILSKSALCYIESQAPNTERERDASLRAWEVVMVTDYGVFEIDDSYGAPMRYEILSPATT